MVADTGHPRLVSRSRLNHGQESVPFRLVSDSVRNVADVDDNFAIISSHKTTCVDAGNFSAVTKIPAVMKTTISLHVPHVAKSRDYCASVWIRSWRRHKATRGTPAILIIAHTVHIFCVRGQTLQSGTQQGTRIHPTSLCGRLQVRVTHV